MPYIGNVVVDFNVDTDNINNSAVTAVKLSPSVGSNGQVLSVDANGALQWTTDAAGMPTSGGTFTGNVLFNDDVKARFGHDDGGSGGDVDSIQGQLWWDETNNYFNLGLDTGSTHKIDISAQTVEIRGVNRSSNMAIFRATGATDLFHGANKKFETSNTGVTVTGTVVATAYTGDGSNLTGIAALTGSTNNTICTVTGANAITGESTLQWSGNALSTYRDSATTYGPGILGHHQRGTIASPSVSQTDDTLLNIVAKGYDGDEYHDAARIDFVVGSGTPGNNDMPGSILFKTTGDGQASSSTRVTIQQNGNLLLDSSSTLLIPDAIQHVGDTNTQIRFPAADTVSVETGGSERLRIDSSGRVMVGHTTSTGKDSTIQSVGTGSNAIEAIRFNNNAYGPSIHLTKSRSSTKGTNTIVQDDDDLGIINFRGADGSGYILGAEIRGEVDGTPGTNDMPGRLVFATTADGASSTTERLRITSAGNVGINDNNPANQLIVKAPGGSGHTAAKVLSGDGNTSLVIQTIQGSEGRMGVDSNHPLALYAGQNESLRITSGGDLTLGTTVSNERVHIHTASSLKAQQQFTNTTTGTGGGDGLVIGITGGEEAIFWNQEDTDTIFATDNTERLRIDSDGNVSIPNNSGKLKLGDGDDLQIYANGNNSLITHNGDGNLHVEATGSGEDLYLSAADIVYIRTNSSETAVRCVADGAVELYYNTASYNSKRLETTDGGVNIQNNAGANTGITTILNLNGNPNNTNDGSAIVIQRAGSSASKIVSKKVAANNTTDLIFYTRTSNSIIENSRLLGAGGITFNGDTAAANALDDYEEGSWTPTIDSGGWTLSSTNKANYTKIGNRVFVTLYIAISGSGSGSNFIIDGLPYTCEGNGYNTGAVDFGLGGKKGAYVRTYSSGTKFSFFYSSESTSTNRYQIVGTDLGAGYVIFSISYQIA